MQYNLKNKIIVTNEFLNELIGKSWQEVETLQQQIANIDTSSQLGTNVVKLLKNTCTSYYTLIGCLETLAEEPETALLPTVITNETDIQEEKQELMGESVIEALDKKLPTTLKNQQTEVMQNFEPFEYFVDFEEPLGKPITDEVLYH